MFDQMLKSGCKPDGLSHTNLILAFERGGQWSRALKVSSRAVNRALQQNVTDSLAVNLSHTCLILALERGGQWSRALKVSPRGVRNSLSSHCRPPLYSHSIVAEKVYKANLSMLFSGHLFASLTFAC